MSTLKLAMMGTGEFAAPTFEGLFETSHQVVALYTQPPRTGEGHHRRATNRMVEIAETHAIPIFRPSNVNVPQSLEELQSLSIDLLVVAAYGQILSEQLLKVPTLGAINVHGSVLPKYRGAAPVSYAILNGETETGVSIVQIEPRLDAGPVLGVKSTPIGPEETAGSLEKRLAILAAPLTRKVIDEIVSGHTSPSRQDPQAVTLAPKLKKSRGAIDWTKTAEELDRHIRAMQPWPNAFTFWHREGRKPLRVVITRVRKLDAHSAELPGTVLSDDDDRLIVQTESRPVEIVAIQPEGKRVMTAEEFLCGHKVQAGERFGP